MDDQDMRDMLRPLARTIVDPNERRAQANITAAFARDGSLKASALRQSLPPLMLVWYLPGAISTGANVGAEIPLSGDIRITQVAAHAKTAPTSQATFRLMASGAEVEAVTIQPNQTSGRSSVLRDVGIRSAGQVLRIDAPASGGAEDVTVTVSYTVVD